MSWIRMAIGAAAFVGIASVATAQGSQTAGPPQQGTAKQGKEGVAGDPGAPREARMARRLFAGIDLTDAQKAQVEKIMEKSSAEMQALMPAPVNGERVKPDDAARAKMMDISTKAEAEYRTILTADQQKTFDSNVAEIKARMDKRKQQGKDGG